jgi:hypothetical protein
MVSPKTLWGDDEDETGCAYILDEDDVRQICGAPLRPASPYCPQHHAPYHRSRAGGGPSRHFLKRLERHVAYGSNAAEAGDLREVEALAPVAAGELAFLMNSMFMIRSE